jgi:hypothetical protein
MEDALKENEPNAAEAPAANPSHQTVPFSSNCTANDRRSGRSEAATAASGLGYLPPPRHSRPRRLEPDSCETKTGAAFTRAGAFGDGGRCGNSSRGGRRGERVDGIDRARRDRDVDVYG